MDDSDQTPAVADALAFAYLTGRTPKCVHHRASIAVILATDTGGDYRLFFKDGAAIDFGRTSALWRAGDWLLSLGFTADDVFRKRRAGPSYVGFHHDDGRTAFTGRSGNVYITDPSAFDPRRGPVARFGRGVDGKTWIDPAFKNARAESYFVTVETDTYHVNATYSVQRIVDGETRIAHTFPRVAVHSDDGRAARREAYAIRDRLNQITA